MNKHTHRLVFSRARGFCVAVAETARAAGKSASGEGGRAGKAAAAVVLATVAASASAQAGGAGASAAGLAPKASLAAPARASTPLPTGGTVVKGSATISSNGTDLTVNQASQRLIADWQSFSIGAGNTVRFVQPSSSSVALNRITGDEASSIYGSLVANGHVFLQNSNGVYFAPGAQVSVGGLLATSLIVDPDKFMLGKVSLSQGSTASGEVVNAGSIVTAPGGSVVLAGPVVGNSGFISTPGGTTALAAGNAVEIDPTGSGLLSISVPVAAVNARLAQSGRIEADGGAVRLAAAATDAALRTVMQVDGVVRARSIENRGGEILLSGGSSGNVVVSGVLDASGATAGTHGGTVKVLGESISLAGTARLDASGAAGGGSVLVGGNWHGAGSEQNASNTTVGAGVVLDASAGTRGNGGEVVVWSDKLTTFAGEIKATGGAASGDGGHAEVSGKDRLDFTGGADMRAPNGKRGSLLLDPLNLDIGNVADLNGNGTTGDDVNGNIFSNDNFSASSKITATKVAQLLFRTDLTLEARENLTVSAPINVAAGGSFTTLELHARNVTINAPMTLNNTSLVTDGYFSGCSTTALETLTINAPIRTLQSMSLTGQTIDIFASLDASNLSFFGTTIGIFAPISASNQIYMLSDGSITTPGGVQTGSVSTPVLTIEGTSVVNLGNVAGVDDNAGNQIGVLDITANSASVRVDNPIGTPSGVTVLADITRNFNLVSASGVTQPDASEERQQIRVGGNFAIRTFDSDPSTGAVTLLNPDNSVGGRFSFNTASDLTFVVAGDLKATGVAGGDLSLTSSGVFRMAGSITANGFNGIAINGNGFDDSLNFDLSAPNGFFNVVSNDYTKDNLGSQLGFGQLQFVCNGNTCDPVSTTSLFNYEVFDGATTAPSQGLGRNGYGSGFVTNQGGSISVSSVGSISRTYNADTLLGVDVPVTATTLVGNNPLPDNIVTLTSDGQAFDNKNVGSGKAYTMPAGQGTLAVGESGAIYFGLAFGGFRRPAGPAVSGLYGESDVTPYSLALAGLTANDKVYDTTRLATLSGSASISPLGEDNVGLRGTGSGLFGDKNVGNGKAVTVTGYSLSGSDAGNYTLDTTTLFASITQAQLALTGISAANKVYDTTTAATLTGTARVTPLGGDSVSVGGTGSGAFGDKNVGTGKAVAVSGYTLTGTDAGNYNLVEPTTLTANISQALLAIGGIGAADKVYDTTRTATLTGSATVTPLGSDSVSVAGTGSGLFANKNVGTGKAVTVSGFTLTGTDAGNYLAAGPSGVTASITPAALAIAGIGVANKVYDSTAAASLTGTARVTPLGGDSVSVTGSGTGAFADKNVGNGKAVTVGGFGLGGTDAGNYTVIEPSGLSANITPATLAVIGVGAANKVYDTTTAATLTGTARITPLGGDSVSLGGTASGSFADKNVGTNKAVTVGGYTLGGADAGNYTLAGPSGIVASITPASLAVGGLSVANKTYDGTTAATLTGTGNVNPIGTDVVSLGGTGTAAFVDKNAGTGKPVTLGGFTLTGRDAGNYVVVAPAGLQADILKLVVMPIGITAGSRLENGTTNVALDTSKAGIAGILPGDSVVLVTGSATGTVASPGPGASKSVTVSGLTLGGLDAGNYSVVSPTGVNVITVTILSAAEQIFAELRSKEYLQALSDAQEPFRRAIAESLASGFGKENIRKQLARGLVFETGPAPPAIETIDKPKAPEQCSPPAGASLSCP